MGMIITKMRTAAQIRIPTLLGAQTLFNVGFYAVVPFIALTLGADFGLAGAAVGLVLGVRTFAQQGLSVIGGSLADRFGARRIILTGIATRTAGFATLAASLLPERPLLGAFIAGTVLTGFGGALFSPGLAALIAEAERDRRSSRATLFAWLTVTGEVGAAIGPLLGSMLLGLGFAAVAGAGAAYFAAVGALLALLLPRTAAPRPGESREREEADPSPRPARGATRGRGFLAFATLHSVDLLAYNQLYLAVPLALAQSEHPARAVALVFAWVSLLTLAAQLPLARWAARVGAAPALRVAYAASAAGFLLVAAACAAGAGGGAGPDPGVADAVQPLAFAAASCFAVGHLLAHPTALHLVPEFAAGAEGGAAGAAGAAADAETRPDARTRAGAGTGARFGLLSTLGGTAVLLGNLGAGLLLDALPAAWAPLPWLLLGALPAAAAVAMPGVLRRALPAPGAATAARKGPAGLDRRTHTDAGRSTGAGAGDGVGVGAARSVVRDPSPAAPRPTLRSLTRPLPRQP